MSRAASALLAVALLIPAVAEAQSRSDQERVVDSLAREWKVTVNRLARFDDSVKAVRLANDTVVAPPLRILVEPGLREVAEPAARRAADTVTAHAGAAAQRLDGFFFVVRRVEQWERRPYELLVRVLDARGREGISQGASVDTMGLSAAMADIALRTLAGTTDVRFRAWVGAEVRWDSMPTAAWGHPRLNLLSLTNSMSRACYGGDLTACASALGLVPTTERDWHAGLRSSLARVAVQIGGQGAFERLLLATGSPDQQLTTTAGVPLDSIISAWHTRVRHARVPSGDMSIGIATMSMFWILVCGALSLRSSRWR